MATDPQQPLIWWLSQADHEAIERHGIPTMLPEWVASEVRSANGRNGRGRLWVPREVGPIPSVDFDDAVGTAIDTYARSCSGIVILRYMLTGLAHLPGLVTDFELRRVA